MNRALFSLFFVFSFIGGYGENNLNTLAKHGNVIFWSFSSDFNNVIAEDDNVLKILSCVKDKNYRNKSNGKMFFLWE